MLAKWLLRLSASILVSRLQPLNAASPSLATWLGRLMAGNWVHWAKARLPMRSTPLPSSTDTRWGLPSKALVPMLFTEAGMTIDRK